MKPVDGGFYEWGHEIAYHVVVEDREEGASSESPGLMKMQLLLSHFVDASAAGNAEAAYLAGAGKNVSAWDCRALLEGLCFLPDDNRLTLLTRPTHWR